MNITQKKALGIFLFLIDIAALFFCIEIFFAISSFLLLLLASKELKRQEVLLVGIFDILFMISILIENDRFQFWSQVDVLLSANTSLAYWFATGHRHAIRLLVSYPGYLISCASKIGLNQGFTIYIGFVFELLYVYGIKILKIYTKRVWMSGFLLGGGLIFLSFVMNGRLAFAYLGLLLIVYGEVCFFNSIQNRKSKKWLRIGVGFVLATVSSGTMLFTASYIGMIFIVEYFCRTNIEKRLKMVIGITWVGIFAIPLWSRVVRYIVDMINKNIVYYGGGITGVVNMLQHGIGKWIFVSDPNFYFIYFILLVGVLFINFLLFRHLIIKKYWEQLPLYLAINLGIYGFAVGISTGTMMLIPMMLLILIKISQKNVLGYNGRE